MLPALEAIGEQLYVARAEHMKTNKGLTQTWRLEREVKWEERHATEEIARGVEQVARLSAMDGAVIINPGFEVIGAGYVVPTGTGAMPPVIKATDLMGSGTAKFEGSGARHAAGIPFADLIPGSVVFVVSADGPVTCITRHEAALTAWSVWVPET